MCTSSRYQFAEGAARGRTVALEASWGRRLEFYHGDEDARHRQHGGDDPFEIHRLTTAAQPVDIHPRSYRSPNCIRSVPLCRMRPQVAHEQIAARFFSLEEQEALAQVPDEERRTAFYNIWTRKEAYVKARGDGIAAGLGTFAVSLGAEAALLRSDEGRDEVERWKLIALEPADGYVAALCGAGVDWRLRSWCWRA